jgi:hypothetical protein
MSKKDESTPHPKGFTPTPKEVRKYYKYLRGEIAPKASPGERDGDDGYSSTENEAAEVAQPKPRPRPKTRRRCKEPSFYSMYDGTYYV